MTTVRKYISYECSCGYKRKYLLNEDPKYFGCPKCEKRNTFYKKEIEEKIKRGKIERKK